jgi:hypothetical protein
MAIADERKTISDADLVTVVSSLRRAYSAPVGEVAPQPLDPFETPAVGAGTVQETGYGHGV